MRDYAVEKEVGEEIEHRSSETNDNKVEDETEDADTEFHILFSQTDISNGNWRNKNA